MSFTLSRLTSDEYAIGNVIDKIYIHWNANTDWYWNQKGIVGACVFTLENAKKTCAEIPELKCSKFMILNLKTKQQLKI